MWLRGEATGKEVDRSFHYALAAIRDIPLPPRPTDHDEATNKAAWSAASAAAHTAICYGNEAVHGSVMAVCWAAMRAAAHAAESRAGEIAAYGPAWSAAKAAQNAELTRRLLLLGPEGAK
jgi:hypothetical protein